MVPIEEWLSKADSYRRDVGLPLVTLSWAQSLDGSLARRRGEPLALSGPASLELTHRLRAAHDAILVGIGTILADNPQLTVRLVEGRDPQPVVLDSHLRLPLDSRLMQRPDRPWIATRDREDPERAERLQAAGARLLPLPADSAGRVSLPHLLRCLASLGVNSLMVEGGAQVLSAFLQAQLVNLLVLTVAPRFVGGLHAIEPANGQDPVWPRLEQVEYIRLGDDQIVSGIPLWPNPSP